MPSTISRWRLLAATSITPTIIAISKPPKAASTSTGSVTSRCRPWAPCSTTIRWASCVGVHVRAATHQVAHRACRSGATAPAPRFRARPRRCRRRRCMLPRSLSPISMPARMAAWAWSSAHGGADARVARAVGDLAHQQAVVRRPASRPRRSRPPSARAAGCARTPPAAAGRSAACCTVLVRSACAGGVADAVHRQAVVGGEDQQLRIAKARLERVLHQPQAHRQRLQFAQAAAGFGAARQLSRSAARAAGCDGGRDRASGWRPWRAQCSGERAAVRAGSAQEQPVHRVVGLFDAGVGQRVAGSRRRPRSSPRGTWMPTRMRP